VIRETTIGFFKRIPTMKAAVYSGRGQLNVVDRKVPEPAAGWVRIGVSAVGICGSDLHIFSGILGDVTVAARR
jgi:threonine dehydrogenase-like Zn-dependent dehydrogenase